MLPNSLRCAIGQLCLSVGTMIGIWHGGISAFSSFDSRMRFARPDSRMASRYLATATPVGPRGDSGKVRLQNARI